MNISQVAIFKWHTFSNNKNKNINKHSNTGISLQGSQVTPLADKDYETALENLPDVVKKAKEENPGCRIRLHMLDTSKINGIQKGIKVFEGLTMGEIYFMLKHPHILLNRCCLNNCAHCGFYL